MAERHPEIEVLASEEEFLSNRKDVKLFCTLCDTTFSKPSYNALNDKHGCPHCANSAPAREKFYNFMADNYPDYELLDFYYDAKTAVHHKCPKCDEIIERKPTAWYKVKPENACPYCGAKAPWTFERAARFVKELNPNLEVVELEDGRKGSITIHCSKCNETWSQTAGSVFYNVENNKNGLTCRACERWGTWSHEDFVAAVAETSPDIEVIGQYTTNNKKILCRCKNCNNYMMIRPDQLHIGVDACMHCKGNGHCSASEKYLRYFLQDVLGISEVRACDKSVIGKELDIYLPNYDFAIEWSGWFWHYNKLDNDNDKFNRCKDKGIKLLCIYDGTSCLAEKSPIDQACLPPGSLTYPKDLYWWASDHKELRKICSDIYESLTGNTLPLDYDWDKIEDKFERHAGSDPTPGDFEEAGIVI